MYFNNLIWTALDGSEKLCIIPKMANRHGLIAGATGTGKTITLKVLAESFSDAGVPVFLSDVKGDLAGMCKPGIDSADMQNRIKNFGLADAGFQYQAYPVNFWDVHAENGLPLRTTVSEFGPLLFARLLDLNQTQSDILNIVFRIADEEKLLLLDMKDLRAMLNYVSENADTYQEKYGNIGKTSIGAIMRALVSLEDQGGDKFFGEPALDIHDWFGCSAQGKGIINILDSRSLMTNPATYSTFMLWMLSELFEIMPEAGDPEKPKMVFFFDEAHLLFDNAPKALLQKIEQVMKLIRSKGIGVFFVTQNPSDIPDDVLAQLGNKIQHGLHAYTPAEQKGIRAAADSFRTNPAFDTAKALQELGTGEAIISFLRADGSPDVCRRAKVLPPQSQMGPVDDIMRQACILASPLKKKYADMVDRDSAYEFLQRKSGEEAKTAEAEKTKAEADRQAMKEETEKAKADEKARVLQEKEEAKAQKAAEKEAEKNAVKTKRRVATVAGAAVGTIGRELGNQLGKSVGGTFGRRIGGNVGATLGRGILQTLLKL